MSWNNYKGQLIDKGDLFKTLTDNRIPVDRDINYFICEQPTVDVFADLKTELSKLRQNFKGKEVNVDVNQDYLTGYLSAVSTMEGILAEVEERYKSENL